MAFETPGDTQMLRNEIRPEFSPELELHIQEQVRRRLADMEGKMSGILENFTEDLGAEVEREQQHLLLMQDQVDKQGQSLTRELAEINKKLEQEKTQRSYLLSTVRENRESLQKVIDKQAAELERMQKQILNLQAPWFVRFFSQFYNPFACCRPPSLNYSYPARALEFTAAQVRTSSDLQEPLTANGCLSESPGTMLTYTSSPSSVSG